MNQVTLGRMEQLSYAKRESLNTLRTNISFCGDDIKVIVVTSCTPDEGKSSTVIDLGRSLAENAKSVLIIDCDLRKSVLAGRHHAKVKGGEMKGLTHYLTGQATLEDVLLETNIPKLDMIFAGRMTPSPTELLGNNHFKSLIEKARLVYDVILIDSPPLGSVIDTAIVAPQCDGAILLIESNKNSYRFAQNIKKQLELTGVRILGAILNKVEEEVGGYHNRYYQAYQKEYYGHNDKTQ